MNVLLLQSPASKDALESRDTVRGRICFTTAGTLVTKFRKEEHTFNLGSFRILDSSMKPVIEEIVGAACHRAYDMFKSGSMTIPTLISKSKTPWKPTIKGSRLIIVPVNESVEPKSSPKVIKRPKKVTKEISSSTPPPQPQRKRPARIFSDSFNNTEEAK